MAGPIMADRVGQVTTATGTGTISLEPTVATGLRSFVAGVGNGNTCFYCISHQTADEWEVGLGTVTDSSPDTLSRDTILSSSNGGSAVNFSAGTKDVFTVAPAVYGTPVIDTGVNHRTKRMEEEALGSVVGGARATQTTDLQAWRDAANEVTAGNYSGIIAGKGNRCGGSGSFTGAGKDNIINNTNLCAVFGGHTNTASQNYSCVMGGKGHNSAGSLRTMIFGGLNNTTASSDNIIGGGESNSTGTGGNNTILGGSNNTTGGAAMMTVLGGERAVAAKRSQHAHAAGRFAANGDAQTSSYIMRRATTNATPTELGVDGSTGKLTLANDTTYTFDILVVARRTNANDESAAYHFVGCIDRNATAGTTALVGSVTKTVIAEDTAAWDVNVTADTTNGAIAITVTGEALKNINWVAHVRTVETTG